MSLIPRARQVGAVVAAVAVTVLAILSFAQTSAANVGVTPADSTSPSMSPPPTTPPSPSPSVTSSPPGDTCSIGPSPSPAPNLAGVAIRVHPDAAGPVTCTYRRAVVKVAWDGTNITVTLSPNPNFSGGNCKLDPKSVVANKPANAKVNADGTVTVPYDKAKAVAITIQIDFNIVCTAGDLTITNKETTTIEFTPPDGPVVITEGGR
jgi:hypothetical protein